MDPWTLTSYSEPAGFWRASGAPRLALRAPCVGGPIAAAPMFSGQRDVVDSGGRALSQRFRSCLLDRGKGGCQLVVGTEFRSVAPHICLEPPHKLAGERMPTPQLEEASGQRVCVESETSTLSSPSLIAESSVARAAMPLSRSAARTSLGSLQGPGTR